MNLRKLIAAVLFFLAWSPSLLAQTVPEATADYTVGSADVLSVEVFDESELTGEYTVSSKGEIVFPLLGSVPVIGMTSKAVEDRLTELLEQDYLYDATVSVRVITFRSRTVKVLGSVVRPGVYYLEGPTRLLDVLSNAGGIASATGEVTRGQVARVVRPTQPDPSNPTEEPKPQTVLVDLYELLVEGIDSANLTLEQGDTVYVPETVLVHVVGEVKKPDSFPYEVGMTVLKAITLAGGSTQKGSPRNAVIKRIREGKEVRIDATLEDLLEPDDIVEVPRSFW